MVTVVIVATLYVVRGRRTMSDDAATQQSSLSSYVTESNFTRPRGTNEPSKQQVPAVVPSSASDDMAMSGVSAGEDLSEGLDLPPPALSSGPPSPRPPRPVMSEAETIEHREQGLVLLDDTIARLERQAQEQEQGDDAEGARLTRIRLERMKAVRTKRQVELDELRE